jgi:hypothetical protein
MEPIFSPRKPIQISLRQHSLTPLVCTTPRPLPQRSISPGMQRALPFSWTCGPDDPIRAMQRTKQGPLVARDVYDTR